MLIGGIEVTLNPWREDEALQIVRALADHLRCQPAFVDDHVGAALAAAAAVSYLFDELSNAARYIWLRNKIRRMMPDPGAWDGDGTEEGALARYIQQMATASHGDCDVCGRRIAAGERFDAIGNVGNWVPEGSPDTHAVICGNCA